MNFYFTISYTPGVRMALLGSRKVTMQIDSIAVLSETGGTFSRKGESIRELRKAIVAFVEMERSKAERLGEKTIFIGYECAVDTLLLQHLTNCEVTDLAGEYAELVNAMSDEDFGLDSEYAIQKIRLPQRKYTLADKMDMIQSHPDFPKASGVRGDIHRCFWLQGINDFDLFRLHAISMAFQQAVSDNLRKINNEQ